MRLMFCAIAILGAHASFAKDCLELAPESGFDECVPGLIQGEDCGLSKDSLKKWQKYWDCYKKLPSKSLQDCRQLEVHLEVPKAMDTEAVRQVLDLLARLYHADDITRDTAFDYGNHAELETFFDSAMVAHFLTEELEARPLYAAQDCASPDGKVQVRLHPQSLRPLVVESNISMWGNTRKIAFRFAKEKGVWKIADLKEL
jgi:hypothetical protein